MPDQKGISAFLIGYKNEEELIERCLGSLQGVVDEIIVIHDGEFKDQKLKIARKYTYQIFIEVNKAMIEPHQIQALKYTNFSWILKIEADEFLSNEMRTNIQLLLYDERYGAYSFVWPIWDGLTYISENIQYKEALFRREKFRSTDFPHKNYTTSGNVKKFLLC